MLRASAKEFSFAPKVEEPFYFDEFVESALMNLPKKATQGYYIKGGKAYNHYFPQGYIPSSDDDLIATNDVCDILFNALIQALPLDKPVYVEGYEPFYISHVNAPTQSKYNDVSIITGKQVTNVVRSLSVLVEGMDIALMDVIIEDENNIAEEAEQGENGLWYMNKDLFKKDLKLTYESREKMVRYVYSNPPKRMTQKVADKAASLEHKLAKSQHRYEISLQGRKRSRRSSRSSRPKKHPKRSVRARKHSRRKRV